METRNSRVSPAAVAAVIPAFALALVLFRYFSFPAYLTVPLTLLLAWAMKKTAEFKSKRLFGMSALFSALLAASFVLGRRSSLRGYVVYFVALTVVFFFFVVWIAGLILRHPINLAKKAGTRPGTVWAVCALILFLSWIPCLLVFYPGCVSVDSLDCIIRAVGKAQLSNQQSVFYILLMRPFLLFSVAIGKSLNFGTALFLAFQAAAMAVMLGYFPCWLAKRQFPRWTVLLSMAYFVLNPVFPMYSVTMWKDVLFGALLLLYVLNLYDIVRSGGAWLEKKHLFMWFLTLNVLIAFLRNNGYYIIFVTLAVVLTVYRKLWKRLLPAFLALLVVIPIVQGPVYRLCGIIQSPFAESFAIPLQQIGYTVEENGKMTSEQRTFLNELLPLDEMKKAYKPHTADGIKFDPQFNNAFLEKNKVQFLKVWLEMAPANLKYYGEAFLRETLGYWHIGTTNWLVYYGIGEDYGAKEKAGLAMSNLWNLAGNRAVIQQTLENLQKAVPALSLLVNIGFLFWSSLFSAAMLLIRKKKKLLLAYLPLWMLWATLMAATPIYCEFRYMFAFAVAFPAMVAFAFPIKSEPAPAAERNAVQRRESRLPQAATHAPAGK